MIDRADVVVIGAGMAGASLAAEIAGRRSVLILEGETQPGYHSTGRSAAFWAESYGGPGIQPLTSASGPFLQRPPVEFHNGSFLRPRGAITLGRHVSGQALEDMVEQLARAGVEFDRLDRAALVGRLPGLRPEWVTGIAEPSCRDIDVAALHAAYLRAARRAGVRLLTNARVTSISRLQGQWRLETRSGAIAADVIVNAAGAWADHIAELADISPVGIQPYRRTIVQVRCDPPAAPHLPLVLDVDGKFYFKPEAGGRLWVSPHDETPCAAGDCAPEEMDVALAVDRLQQVVDWTVLGVEHSWAGLRSFAPDRLPVYGFRSGEPGFFWCAGQGGFGIQTAPAGAKVAAALLLGQAPDTLAAELDPLPYSVARFPI